MLKKVHVGPGFSSSEHEQSILSASHRTQATDNMSIGCTCGSTSCSASQHVGDYKGHAYTHNAAERTEPVPLPDLGGALNV